MDLPHVFIGSSTSALNVARYVKAHLESVADVTVWRDLPSEKTLSKTIIESIIGILDEYDFAVLVFAADDAINDANHKDSTFMPRDNVIFELGLFIARLGRERTFILLQADVNLKLATDLKGVLTAPYNGNTNNLRSSLSTPCIQICDAIRSLGSKQAHSTIIAIKYGDIIRLRHRATNHYLYSQPINYKHPRTSGQQQVNAFSESGPNAYWVVEAAYGLSYEAGKPVQNGDVIRLMHQSTHTYLHSHIGFPSPITQQQEVTAFSSSDANDNWKVELHDRNIWEAGQGVKLIHSSTKYALHSHAHQSHSQYTQGQQEVTCFPARDDNDWWTAEPQSE